MRKMLTLLNKINKSNLNLNKLLFLNLTRNSPIKFFTSLISFLKKLRMTSTWKKIILIKKILIIINIFIIAFTIFQNINIGVESILVLFGYSFFGLFSSFINKLFISFMDIFGKLFSNSTIYNDGGEINSTKLLPAEVKDSTPNFNIGAIIVVGVVILFFGFLFASVFLFPEHIGFPNQIDPDPEIPLENINRENINRENN